MTINRLTWGVKASFRSYVQGAGGSIALDDGATQTDEGTFVFSAVPGGDLVIGADGSATGSMRFQGTVSFDAHGGMLKATLSELGVEAADDGLVLTVKDAMLPDNRCAIADLNFVEADADATTLGAQITIDGMYQIADNYPPGTELDPVRLD